MALLSLTHQRPPASGGAFKTHVRVNRRDHGNDKDDNNNGNGHDNYSNNGMVVGAIIVVASVGVVAIVVAAVAVVDGDGGTSNSGCSSFGVRFGCWDPIGGAPLVGTR